MVMDYVEGQNLIQVIEEKGVFSEANGLKIIQKIGQAVSYIHSKNYLHRDIKPQNILLRKQDNKAILIDFGLAREVDFAQSMTLTSAKTPAYAPPEQFVQRDKFTPALDVYSLAATLYVLLAVHESPFIPLPSPHLNAKIMLDLNIAMMPPKNLNPAISQQVNDAILQGMALDVNQRPKSVEAWFKLLGIEKKQSKGRSLISSLGIDYTKLDQLLANGKWREADQETEKKLLEVMGKDSWTKFSREDVENFSKEDLRIMDSLWVKYSNGRFGFSVQKEIWIACGGTPGVSNRKVYEKFGDRIGWRKLGSWISLFQLAFNTSGPREGHLPSAFMLIEVVFEGCCSSLFSRL